VNIKLNEISTVIDDDMTLGAVAERYKPDADMLMSIRSSTGNGLMAPCVGIAASHQANQVVRILLGEAD
jgi:hypothetical protein